MPKTHVDPSLFTGGQFFAQGGFVEGEIAAAQFTIPAADFPIKIVKTEMIFATFNATETTTTHWSVLFWEGPPNASSPVDTESSDGTILPHLVMGPGTNGTNVLFTVDAADPEQIILHDTFANDPLPINRHTITVGYRVDQHNAPPPDPCFILDPDTVTCCNAFPTTSTGPVNQVQLNWLFGIDCGILGCPPNGGWARFSELAPSGLFRCRPSGDWMIRVTYTAINCTPLPTVSAVSPTAATNNGITHLTVTGTNFVVGGTAVQLEQAAQPPIVATNVVVNPSLMSLTADVDLNAVGLGQWNLKVTTSGGTGTLPGIPSPPGFSVIEPTPPTVTGFTPVTSPNNTTINASVTGTNFVIGATDFKLTLGGTTINGTSVNVTDSQHATATFDLHCVPTSTTRYTCTAMTSAGAGPGFGAITVTALSTPPTIIGRSPSSGQNCPSEVAITVNGNGSTGSFQSGAQVFLTRAGFADVAATSMTVSSGTALTARFNLATGGPGGTPAATGAWNIKVVNPDCQMKTSTLTFAVNACTPTINSITPNSTTNQVTLVSITDLAGNNFLSGVTVRLTRTGRPDIVATNVVVSQDHQHIMCDLNPYLAQAGSWNVVVTNPGAPQQSLNNAFGISLGDPPAVGGVFPGDLENCGPQNLIVFGTTFLTNPNPTVRLRLPGHADIVGTNVMYVDSTQITADFGLGGATVTPGADKWDCILTNPDGQSSNPALDGGLDALNVLACSGGCTKGDLNGDGLRDGADVNAFVRVLLTGNGTQTEICAADLVAPFNVVDSADASAFVGCLLTGACP